jgi:malonate transporter MadL subunit
MKIYGVALLAGCFLLGKYLGSLLGLGLGINGDVGGVGFAMLFLMLTITYLKSKNQISPESESGIQFWSGMYIPIIVAMVASLNVKAAVSQGSVPIVAGIVVCVVGYALVPILSRIGLSNEVDHG